MNIVSKCRCGAAIDVTASDIPARCSFIEWLKLHEKCPQKMFSSHIAFKHLLRKAQGVNSEQVPDFFFMENDLMGKR